MVRIGETFKYKNKVYAAVLTCDGCKGCAFNKGLICLMPPLNKLTENCNEKNNTIGATIIFKEVKKYMEIKDNKLTINIPEGMEIDIQNSNLKAGVIKFKKKEIDYLDVCTSLGSDTKLLPITTTNCEKVKAIDKLIDIANYYNKGWKPDWSNKNKIKFYIAFDTDLSFYEVRSGYMMAFNIVYFKNRKDAQAVIDNPNFREILDTIYKN